jgi:hypothetical protein
VVSDWVAAWAYAAFVERAAGDHRNHPQVGALLDALPTDSTWADLAVRIIPLLRSNHHPLLEPILERLATYAQTGDPQAQDCYARGRFAAANLLFFAGQRAGTAGVHRCPCTDDA